MVKITARVDDELAELLEERDESKSEAVRTALRLYAGIEMDGEPRISGYVLTRDLRAMHRLGSRSNYDDAEAVINEYLENDLTEEADLLEWTLDKYRE